MLSKKVTKATVSIGLGMTCFYVTNVFAANDIASIANTVSDSFSSIGKLMAATAYLASSD